MHAYLELLHPNLDGCCVVDVKGDQVQRGAMLLMESLQCRRLLRLPSSCHHVIPGRQYLGPTC